MENAGQDDFLRCGCPIRHDRPKHMLAERRLV
jgi:hypothetical protein